ncbi:EAL domain-containing protein [Phaeobacter piscinae]|uniref:Diguanylate cyclase domain-containing transport protein n=1 Tax=Phaeobacter piscinae TaxID=1580596 RepID=A0AAN1GR24_9RHOB|nr:EAL domain-containing protein [Phaeobacter piscinae]ATG43508.1 diguanylate cyclase domain-containing transport protein [Phaeobacter piscinae]
MAEFDTAWTVIMALLVLILQCGFLCLESGTVREKNAANVALKNLADICLVGTVFWIAGFGLMFGSSLSGLVGVDGFFPSLSNVLTGTAGHVPDHVHVADTDHVGGLEAHVSAMFLFQTAFAATAATIVSGAVAERERFLGYIATSLTLAGLVYPLAGHWIWNPDGWLRQIGFIDFAGATVVHSVGGSTALIAVLFLGPRLGRYGHKNRFFEENSISLMALGGMLLWIGWGAFNGGTAMVSNADVAPIVARTMLSAAGAGVTSIAVGLLLNGHIRAELLINGILGGLVAGTAAIHLVTGPAAFVIGVAGALTVMFVRDVLDALKIDDVVGAVPVHLAAGIVGTLAVAVTVPYEALPAGSRLGQLGIQLLGVGAVGAWVLATMAPLLWMLNHRGLLRAKPRDEVRGLNLAENNQRNALLELLEDMKRHQRSGRFSQRVRVEPSTRLGALAYRYNRVLDRVETEIAERIDALRRERDMRAIAEDAFDAMCEAQKESAWAARHDKLTGIGNRKYLEDFLAAPVRVQGEVTLVMALDLDRFKEINDTYGHAAGDAVLQVVARRLSGQMRDGRDFAFRIGGDEFTAFVQVSDRGAGAEEMCQDLAFSLLEPFYYQEVHLRFGVSVGFAVMEPGEPLKSTLRRADLALYEAKSSGSDRVVAYNDAIGRAHSDKMNLIRDFREALERNEITALFQPQIDAKTGHLIGCEVLARWQHPHRGLLTPDVFLPIAEEMNCSADLDMAILDLALQGYWELHRQGIDLPGISVNVSAARLADPQLIAELQSRDDIPGGALTFELLETVFLDSISDDYAHKIAMLKDLGISIEIDDFGTGHASIAGVLALQPDRLKIDRVFASEIDRKPARQDLMRGLIDMAVSVGAETVVEGVETWEEASVLTALGADVLQGYVIGRPMAFEDLLHWHSAREGQADAVAAPDGAPDETSDRDKDRSLRSTG